MIALRKRVSYLYSALASPCRSEKWRFIALIAICLGVALYRLALLNAQGAPSGADPGNWLALGYELFGEKIKAASVSYPPVAPLLVRTLVTFLPPIVALNIIAAFVSTLQAIPFYLLLKQGVGALWALLFSFALLFHGYSLEVVTFGGYPQLLSQAFLLFTLYWLGKGLVEGRLLFLLLSAALASLTVGTWVVGAVFLAVTVPVLLVLLIVRERPNLRILGIRLAKWAAISVLFGLVYLPFYLTTLNLHAGSGWNPQGYSWASSNEAIRYAFKELPDWLDNARVLRPIFFALIVYCLLPIRRGSIALPILGSLMIGSVAIFFILFEVRVLDMLGVAGLAVLALLFSDLFKGLKNMRFLQALGWLARSALVALCLVLAFALIVVGDQRMKAGLYYFRVADSDAVEALNWLAKYGKPGSIVVESGNSQGIQYLWWIEGYAKLPSYSAVDPRWFNFEEEKRQNSVAQAVLSSKSSAEISRLAEENHIGYIFLDKRVKTLAPQFQEAGFATAFENQTIVVLKSDAVLAEFGHPKTRG